MSGHESAPETVMPYAVNPEISDTETRRAMQRYLDECRLETPEEVAKFFACYTFLIWDYQLFGEIYRLYNDDIVMFYGGRDAVQGLENVISDTLSAKRGMTFRYKHIFADIFAEGDPESGYHFIQATSYFFPDSGDQEQDFEGRILPQGAGSCMCECEIQKINGKWTIVREWMC